MARSLLLPLALALTLSAVGQSFPFDEKDLESDESIWNLYQRWRISHRDTVTRDLADKHTRFHAFKENAKFIHEFNQKKETTYKLALNKFADMTDEEFRNTYASGFKMPTHQRSPTRRSDNAGAFRYGSSESVPSEIDWRAKGAVTAIKNQSACSSGWAFSTVAALEGINKIKTGQLISLSEQELIDCDNAGAEAGCNGGVMTEAFQFIIDNRGITSEENYPYKAEQGTCRPEANVPRVTMDAYDRVPADSETALMEAVARQPISVAIEADGKPFRFYKEGVFNGGCGTSVDHGVVAVGYGVQNNTKYWIVKNSWTANWGESGFIRMERGINDKRGLCGITMAASYPIKTSPNPSLPKGVSAKDELWAFSR